MPVPGAGQALGTQITPRPQQPIQVPITDLKDLIQQRLDYGDCKDAVANLINKAAELSNGKNDAISTDIMKLYGMIDSQPRGGFRLNSTYRDIPSYLPPVSGGSGLSWGNILRGDATAMIFLKGGYSDNPASLARLPYDYGISGIHEIIHLAAKNEPYRERLLNESASKLERGSDFDKYLKNHCLPAKFR
jgi:hypothetical protein